MGTILEAAWWQQGLRVAGIDEAGRGALAGPVVAAAVVLPPPADGVAYPFYDSKILKPAVREALEPQIQALALAWAVGYAEAAEIDRLGILKATHLAAQRALSQLRVAPQALLTDYLHLEREWLEYLSRHASQSPNAPFACPPKADRDSPTVAAASILAKVARDRHMDALEEQYPGYGFAQHKGYGTAPHLQALQQMGPCAEHRRSFAPVAQRPLFPSKTNR